MPLPSAVQSGLNFSEEKPRNSFWRDDCKMHCCRLASGISGRDGGRVLFL